jgi:Flp pilus assembly protein TadD
VIDRESSRFIISPQEIVPHPVTLSKTLPETQRHLYFYSLAYQYDKADKPEQARSAYEQAFRMMPDFPQGIVEYAHFCLRRGRKEKALELAGRLREQDTHHFERCLIQGLAFMQSGRFGEAVKVLEEGNAVYDSDVRLLNALGFCYHQVGQNDRALEVLQASLRLNGEQPAVQELIAELGRDPRDV